MSSVAGSSLDQILSSVTQKVGSYAGGVAQGKISDALQKIGVKVPTEVRGVLSYLLSGTDFDPLQSLMFAVSISDIGFSQGQIRGVSLPTFTLQYRQQRQAGGLMVSYVSNVSIGDLSISFYEDRNGSVISYFDTLRGKIYDPSLGVYGYPSMYKKNVKVSIIDASATEVIGFNYSGCAIKSISAYDMNTSPGNIITPTITFTVDNVTMSVMGKTVSSGISGVVGSVVTGVSNAIKDKISSFIGL